MFFTLEKLERSTKKLKDLRYRERMEIPLYILFFRKKFIS